MANRWLRCWCTEYGVRFAILTWRSCLCNVGDLAVHYKPVLHDQGPLPGTSWQTITALVTVAQVLLALVGRESLVVGARLGSAKQLDDIRHDLQSEPDYYQGGTNKPDPPIVAPFVPPFFILIGGRVVGNLQELIATSASEISWWRTRPGEYAGTEKVSLPEYQRESHDIQK